MFKKFIPQFWDRTLASDYPEEAMLTKFFLNSIIFFLVEGLLTLTITQPDANAEFLAIPPKNFYVLENFCILSPPPLPSVSFLETK